MKYINAEEILPKELIEKIQSYVAGGYLYIPTPQEKKAWGTNTGIRRELEERNRHICRQYARGEEVRALARQYGLCVSSIYKIIRNGSIQGGES